MRRRIKAILLLENNSALEISNYVSGTIWKLKRGVELVIEMCFVLTVPQTLNTVHLKNNKVSGYSIGRLVRITKTLF
jgi:hypothetical protein